MPKRIQLSRRKGYRKPAGVVNVARPTKWGNPFNWRDADAEMIPKKTAKFYAQRAFREWLKSNDPAFIVSEDLVARRQWILDHIEELRGKDLACWCKPSESCHADVLLELANQGD